MNGSIRVSAKTVDDAITEAMIQLGATSDKIEYEVIEKGSPGFLGIGMKQAVIEARRKPEPEPEPEIFSAPEENPVKEEEKAEEPAFRKKEKTEKRQKKEAVKPSKMPKKQKRRKTGKGRRDEAGGDSSRGSSGRDCRGSGRVPEKYTCSDGDGG